MTKQNMTSLGAGPIAHTPIPWHVSHELPEGFSIARQLFPSNPKLLPVAVAVFTRNYHPENRESAKANAELICRAVNSHAALVAALRGLLDADSAICEGTERTSDLAMGRIAAIDAACAALKSAGEQL